MFRVSISTWLVSSVLRVSERAWAQPVAGGPAAVRAGCRLCPPSSGSGRARPRRRSWRRLQPVFGCSFNLDCRCRPEQSRARRGCGPGGIRRAVPTPTVRFCPQLLASESMVPGLCSGRHRVDEGALDSHWPCLPATRPPARPQRPLPAVSVRATVTRAFWLHLVVLCQGLMQCHGDTV